MPFYPGPGLGGHCIPIDPFYLSWKAKEYDFDVRFIELAGEINDSMPYHIVEMVMKALNAYKKALNGSRVLVIGVAYKPNVADPRESPVLKIIPELENMGALVEYYDPYIREIKIDNRLYTSTDLTKEKIKDFDCILIVTDHNDIDYNLIYENAQLIVDTRNALRKRGISTNERVIRL
jgi:UDP-N-acetyl-D-glucosamine dehydrogenase